MEIRQNETSCWFLAPLDGALSVPEEEYLVAAIKPLKKQALYKQIVLVCMT